MSSLLVKIRSWKAAIILICLFPLAQINAAIIPTRDHRVISYTDKGQGTPLILVHAFPTDKELWKAQTETLKQHFRVITLDLWGFGKSSAVDGQAVTMDEYADEMNQLLESLHIDEAIIGGESMGGYIALAFLENYPQKVIGMILSNTQAIADNEETKAKRELSAQDILTHGPSQFNANFLGKAFSDSVSEPIKHNLQTILNHQTATGMASALRGMVLRRDTTQLLTSSLLPILIITGNEDKVINQQQSIAMHTLAKNSKLIVLQNTGHLSNLEQPELWSQAVIAFFKQKN